jgi:hypothetical protein
MNRIFNGKEIDDSTSELARTLEMEPKESREPDKTFELKAIRDLLTPTRAESYDVTRPSKSASEVSSLERTGIYDENNCRRRNPCFAGVLDGEINRGYEGCARPRT